MSYLILLKKLKTKITSENKKQYIRLLLKYPYKFGIAVGFDKLTELHNEWMIHMIRGKTDETLQAHRGSYKTTCVSIALAIIIILYPNLKIAFIRKNDSDSNEIIKQTATILKHELTSLIVRELYGIDLTVEYTSNRINTNLSNDPRGTSQLIGRGCGGTITGQHYDLIFTDDIVTVSDRVSQVMRENTKKFYQELQNIKNRGGRIFNTGTPWHKEDCFTLMPSPIKYDCYNTNLISEDELLELRDCMAPSLFAANYELKHIASEDVIFQNPQTGADFDIVIGGLTHVDSAFYGSDYTAFTCMNFVNGKYYVYGRLWRRHVEELYPTIVELNEMCGGGKLYNEKNADKGLVSRDLKNLGVRVYPYNEGMNKYIKIVTYLKGIWKDVIFVDGTDPKYIEQICDYTEDAEHDDAPDSCSCLAR